MNMNDIPHPRIATGLGAASLVDKPVTEDEEIAPIKLAAGPDAPAIPSILKDGLAGEARVWKACLSEP